MKKIKRWIEEYWWLSIPVTCLIFLIVSFEVGHVIGKKRGFNEGCLKTKEYIIPLYEMYRRRAHYNGAIWGHDCCLMKIRGSLQFSEYPFLMETISYSYKQKLDSLLTVTWRRKGNDGEKTF